MRRLLALALFLAGCGEGKEVPAPTDEPRDWSVSASVDKQKVQVGEDLTLTLVLTHPAEGRYVAPTGTAFGPFEVIARSEETSSPFETRLSFRLAAYHLPEKLEIPSLEIPYQKEGKVETLRTEPMSVEVVTSLTPEVTDIHDIKPPVDLEIPRNWSLLWRLLLALAIALVAYLIYRKLRKAPEAALAPEWIPPLPPADVEAEAALRRLAEKDLIGKGDFPGFYTELAEIMKRYAGRRFEVPYLERTTSEVMSDLKPRKLPAGTVSELGRILEFSDLVKFAKLVPEAREAEESLALARSWIEKTRPAPAAATPEKAIA
jgi:hypothetical protein